MTLHDTFKNLLAIITAHERRRICFIVLLAVVVVLIEMLGAAALFLITKFVTNPNDIVDSQYFSSINSILRIESENLLYALVGLMLAVVSTAVLFRSLLIYVQSRFMLNREYTIGCRILKGIMNEPYESVIKKNSAEITKIVLSEVINVVVNGLFPVVTVVIQSTLILGMTIVMLITSPSVTLVVTSLVALVYFIIYKILGKRIDHFAVSRVESNSKRFKIIDSFFGVYKTAKVEGTLDEYIKEFSSCSQLYAKSNANITILSTLPRGIVELFLLATILIAFALTISSGQIQNFSIFTVFIYAAYKILPAAQSVYAALAQLRFAAPSLKVVLDNLPVSNSLGTKFERLVSPFNGFTFDDVSYYYKDNTKVVLKNLDVSLPSIGYIGVVGLSGSGKTTFVDLLTGLLVPRKGHVYVNALSGGKRKLGDGIVSFSYVPQEIFLFDSSIAHNITLETDPEKQNTEKLESVILQSGLAGVIERLNSGLLTVVGERGAALSGGEKQRVGFARALYRDADVLVLDEVTSALDKQTERNIVRSIESISKEKLVISITHTLENLNHADKILKFEDGSLTSYRSLNQLTR